MIARLATLEEIPYLLERIKESGGIFIDLYRTPCWVAEDEDGVIVGLLAAHLTWQIEPLLVWGETKAAKRRACYRLYRAAEDWLTDGSKNITGIYKAFAITRMVAVRGWAKKMGWSHQFKRAPMFIKNFKEKS